ncbi:MAG: hypothetical protein ACI9YR_001113, partial [Bacteroidia bacterium]
MKIQLSHSTAVCLLGLLLAFSSSYAQEAVQFKVSFDAETLNVEQDGRLLLILATHDEKEPRFLVNNTAQTQLIF